MEINLSYLLLFTLSWKLLINALFLFALYAYYRGQRKYQVEQKQILPEKEGILYLDKYKPG